MKRSRDGVGQFIYPSEAEKIKLLGVCGPCDQRLPINKQDALFLENVGGRFALVSCQAYKNGEELTRPAFYAESHFKCLRRCLFVKNGLASRTRVARQQLLGGISVVSML